VTSGPATWTMYQLADLSGGTSSPRKFFFGPDVIVTRAFAALMLGSGDREKPLLESTHDHFFQIFDRSIAKGAPTPTPSAIVFDNLVATGSTSSTDGAGCYVALAGGEKVVNAATSIAGNTYFGTNRPSTVADRFSCSANLGIAKAYAMPLFCVSPTGTTLTGGGLPPTPVSGIVTVGSGDTAKKVPFIIGAPNPKNSAIEGSRVTPTIKVPRNRIYWYQEGSR